MAETKIDADLSAILSKLQDQESVEALVFPSAGTATLETFLKSKGEEGSLEFNILSMAGCVAVRSNRSVILELAKRDDVQRIAANPKFTANR